MNLVYILIIAYQIIIPTPSWPNLDTPTPFMSPTPEPTPTSFVFQTMTPIPTTVSSTPDINAQSETLSDNISTAEALTNEMSNAVIVQGDQVYWDGEPMLPGDDGSIVAGYLKWLMTSGEGIFGPFYPIVISFGILFTLSLFSLAIYFTPLVITTLINVISWVISLITKFIPGIG